ncbi:MAG: phytanoyl-CoA dioxygenase family protein, partial [Chitinophagaceae bacterium]
MTTATTTKDLSAYHRLVGNLFQWPQSAQEWEQYKLSPEQLQHFEEYGYVSNIRLLDESQVDGLREELQ